MTPAVVSEPAVRVPHKPKRKADRAFFSAMVLLLLATVLWGFSRTYFLAGMMTAPLPNRLIHIHGAVFTLWMVLLVVQTALISARRIGMHRTLGMFGFGLAVVMVVLGTMAAADALRRGEAPLGLDARTFWVIPMSDMFLFSVFVFSAYWKRSRPEAHKRLILISTIALADAAIGRLPIALFQVHPPTQDIASFGFLLAIVVYDLFSLHRVSRTTIWASLLLVVVHLTRVPIGFTPAWHSLADWVMRH